MGYETDHGKRRGQGATTAAFYLGLCRLRGILSPPASATVILQAGYSYLSQRWRSRRAVLRCSSDGAAGGQFLPVAAMVLQAGRSSLPQRKLESDADIVATMPAILCSDSRFLPLNQESMHARWLKPGKACIDSQVRA